MLIYHQVEVVCRLVPLVLHVRVGVELGFLDSHDLPVDPLSSGFHIWPNKTLGSDVRNVKRLVLVWTRPLVNCVALAKPLFLSGPLFHLEMKGLDSICDFQTGCHGTL